MILELTDHVTVDEVPSSGNRCLYQLAVRFTESFLANTTFSIFFTLWVNLTRPSHFHVCIQIGNTPFFNTEVRFVGHHFSVIFSFFLQFGYRACMLVFHQQAWHDAGGKLEQNCEL
jgi:hypothetical protein